VNIHRSPILILLRDSGRLLDRLNELWPDILAYVVSFVTLNVYWLAHLRIFRTEHPYKIFAICLSPFIPLTIMLIPTIMSVTESMKTSSMRPKVFGLAIIMIATTIQRIPTPKLRYFLVAR